MFIQPHNGDIYRLSLPGHEEYSLMVEVIQINEPTPQPQRESIETHGEVKGLVLLHCPSCNSNINTFLKLPKTEFKCNCGEIIMFDNLAKVNARCKCGNSFYGLTNHTEKTLEIQCKQCHSPITVFWNPKLTRYQSTNI